MSRNINVVLYGVGNMGKLLARYMIEKGFNIVGATNRRSHLGEDLGRLAGLNRDLGVVVTSNLEDVYRRHKVDIAVISTSSDMESFAELAREILPRGINILTIADEAFWPWRRWPELTRALDQLARDNNVTVAAGGLQDSCLLNVISVLTGACNSIRSIETTCNSNLDFYGAAIVEHYHIGLTEAEYNDRLKRIDGKDGRPPIFGFPMEALAADLGLNIVDSKYYYTPIIAAQPIRSRSLGRVIDAGLSIGHTEHLEIATKEGISLRSRYVEKIAPLDDPVSLSWNIKGVPDISFNFNNLDGEAVTCATAVNRIAQVIDAEPGYITCERLPKLKIMLPMASASV